MSEIILSKALQSVSMHKLDVVNKKHSVSTLRYPKVIFFSTVPRLRTFTRTVCSALPRISRVFITLLFHYSGWRVVHNWKIYHTDRNGEYRGRTVSEKDFLQDEVPLCLYIPLISDSNSRGRGGKTHVSYVKSSGQLLAANGRPLLFVVFADVPYCVCMWICIQWAGCLEWYQRIN